ncbi:MAG: ferrous iron transport protein A [Proteobacteria bacterium]|nr:ferrous iron transport protein A [Pseudomonadota bacterium]
MRIIIINKSCSVTLSQAQVGKRYKIENLSLLKSLAKRLAVLGLNTGVFIELLSLYKHGALIKTINGNIALDTNILELIQVSSI